ncbi:MAG: catalase [Ruminococcus sp.]|nr:catalase [Ruminococcus sp.]MDE7225350.1 catalase [Ruminococcus sp.]
MLIYNFLGHLTTVLKHRHMVMYHCFKAGIFRRGLLHDLSKFSPSEFIPGVIFFQGSRSPNEREREVNGFSKAWIHHKGRNRHHFEYWTDYSIITGVLEPVEMPDVYIIEMFCDRVAASKIYNKEKYNDHRPLEYYLKRRDKRDIEPKTARKLEYLLRMLSVKGEEYTFRYIRTRIRRNKK